MIRASRRWLAAAAAAPSLVGLPALAQSYVETPLFAERVGKGELPPVARAAAEGAAGRRLAASGRSIGQIWRRHRHPGRRGRATSATFGLRLYPARRLRPRSSSSSRTSSRSVENEDDRIFTFRLRDGHRWSDGASVHGRRLPLLLGGRRATTRICRRPASAEFMMRGRQAAAVRGPRRAHGALHLGQAQPALPAAARRAARPVHLPAGRTT